MNEKPTAPAAAPVNHTAETSPQLNSLQGRVTLTVNNTSKDTIHVWMDGSSMSRKVEKTLAPGESLRAAGHTLVSSKDVVGTITYSTGQKVHFWGYNPEFGWPSVGFGDGSNWKRFSVDETHNFTEAGHNFTVKRNADLDIGGGKDFQIYVK